MIRHELGVHRDDNDGRRGAGRRMVAEAERGGGVAAAVRHLRQDQLDRPSVAFADKLLQPILPHRCRVAVSQCSKISAPPPPTHTAQGGFL